MLRINLLDNEPERNFGQSRRSPLKKGHRVNKVDLILECPPRVGTGSMSHGTDYCCNP